MKNSNFSRLLAIVLAGILLICTLPSGLALNNDRYGYRHLDNDAQRVAYNAFVDGVGKLDATIRFTAPSISFDDIDKAIRCVISDYPEYFWFNGVGSISYDNSGNYAFTTSGYTIDGKTLNADSVNAYKTQLETAAATALSGMPSGSDYDKALYLHDYLASMVEYVSDGGNDDQTAYGALVEGKAVCAGYARAYQYLLRKAGIESWYVTGSSKGQAHGWNLVLLNNKCYYTDVTWDDQDSYVMHTYFMLSLEQMNATHDVSSEDVGMLPSGCGHEDMDYFTIKGGSGTGIGSFQANTTANDVASWCRSEESGKYTCLIMDRTGTLNDWLDSNWEQICKALNLTGTISCNRSYRGQEFTLTFVGTPSQTHTHDAILTKVSAQKPSCTTGGNLEYYTCSGCKTLFKDKAGKDPYTNPDAVKLSPTGHTYSQQKSDENGHWKACSCGAEQAGSRESHSDSNQDNKCDTCNLELKNTSQETTGTEATTPATEATTPATEETVTHPEEPVTTPGSDPTHGSEEPATGDPTEIPTEPAATEGTQVETQAAETADGTTTTSIPSIGTAATENAQSQQDTPSQTPVVILSGVAVAVIGGIISVIIRLRKKKQ